MPNLTATFVDTLLTQQSEKNAIAQMVQSQKHDSPFNRISMTFVQLMSERRAAKARAKASGNALEGEVEIKPEQMMSFVQNLQNSACWAVRRARIAVQQQHENEELLGLSTGLDFGQDIAEQVGLSGDTEYTDIDFSVFYGADSMDTLVNTLEDTFQTLERLYGFLASKMNYIVFDGFNMFVKKKLDEESGEYIMLHDESDWNGAISAMEIILELMPDEEAARLAAEASKIDFETGEIKFSPQLTAKERPVRSGDPTATAAESVGEMETVELADSELADDDYEGPQDCSDLLKATELVNSLPNLQVNEDA